MFEEFFKHPCFLSNKLQTISNKYGYDNYLNLSLIYLLQSLLPAIFGYIIQTFC